MPSSRYRLVLADDHELFLEGLSALLHKEQGLEVVAKAKDGRQAIEACERWHPHLAIVDLSMPGMNGIEAIHRLAASQPQVKVLVLSMHAERDFVTGALAAGATGYLLKDSRPVELNRAIRALLAGHSYVSPAVAGTVLSAFKNRGSIAGSPLSSREREVLQLIAEGLSTKKIARRLRVSVKTVGSHREHLMEKLDIHSIAGLTKYAVRAGLTSGEP